MNYLMDTGQETQFQISSSTVSPYDSMQTLPMVDVMRVASNLFEEAILIWSTYATVSGD